MAKTVPVEIPLELYQRLLARAQAEATSPQALIEISLAACFGEEFVLKPAEGVQFEGEIRQIIKNNQGLFDRLAEN